MSIANSAELYDIVAASAIDSQSLPIVPLLISSAALLTG